MSDLQVVSLFSGIEGIGLGCEQADMTVFVCVEIDPVCRSILRRHFPNATILSDIREVTGDQLRALGVDPSRCVLCFGWPCQDLSVAGRRAGLGGARSGLFWEAMRVAAELRPWWFVAENVFGLLSAVCTCPGDQTCLRAGRDVHACGRWDTKRILGVKRRVFTPHVVHGVPDGACPGGCMARHGGAMGTVVGAMGQLGYGVAYRVLDAQYTGVPQRRRRVFFVGCAGNRGAPVQVLLEPEGVRGGVAAGAASGARVAGTLAASAGSGGQASIGQSANAITSRLVEDEQFVGHTTGAGTLRSDGGGGDARGDHLVVSTVQGGGRRGHRVDVEGAGGGHLIPFDRAQNTSDVNRTNPQPGDPAPSLNGSGQVHVAKTLRSHPRPGSNSDGAVVVTPPAVTEYACTRGVDSDVTGPLIVAHPVTSSMGRLDGTVETLPVSDDQDHDWLVTTFAAQHRVEAKKNGIAEPVTGPKGQPGGVATQTAIRRLTPLECERLQGFPDNWTQVDDKGNPVSDAARYRMIGNAVAVTCSAWIARRLVAVDGERDA